MAAATSASLTAAALLLLVLGAAIGVRGQQASSDQTPLATQQADVPAAFTAIRSCLPFTILVAPPNASATSNGTVSINAEQGVIDGVQASVDSGVLVLSLGQGFSTTRTINLTVTPSSPLQYVQNFGTGHIVVSGTGGGNISDLYLSTTGPGSLFATGVEADTVRILASGANTVYANGTFGAAKISASGLANVFLQGLDPTNSTVEVYVEGISSTWIDSQGPGVSITGHAEQLAKVYYSQGSCKVDNSVQTLFGTVSLFGDPCVPGNITMPMFSPTFTCGLYVDGSTQCPANAAAPSPPAAPAPPTAAPPPSAPPVPGAPPSSLSTSSTSSSTPAGGRQPVSFNTSSKSGPAGSVTTTTSSSGGGSASSSGSVFSGGAAPLSTSSGYGFVPGLGIFNDFSTPDVLSLPISSYGLAVISQGCTDAPPEPLL